MAKPNPDHREQVEFKFGPKERSLLDDLQLNQTFKTGGGIISDIGQGINSVISPFVNGGDAGLVMALATAYIVDDRMDLKSTEQLNEFLGSIQLYAGPDFGIYPSVLGMGAPVCFCRPEDFPAIPKHWNRSLQQDAPWNIWGEVDENFVGPIPLEDIPPGLREWNDTLKWRWINEQGPNIDASRSGPWRSISEVEQYCFENNLNILPWMTLIPESPALTYDDQIPPVQDWPDGLTNLYRFDQINGLNDANIVNIVFVWNNQMSVYGELWRTWSIQARYQLFKLCGGKPRSELDSLSDLLSALSISIPGAGLMNDVVDFITPDRADASDVLQVLETMGGHGVLSIIPSSIAESMRDAGVQTSEEMYLHTQSVEYPMTVKWPVWSTPPKSIYKYETIHSTVEAIKILIPWYLGTKFTIQAASAAGSIIPG